MKRTTPILVFSALLAGLVVAGCGDDKQGASATDTTAFSNQAITETTDAPAPRDKPEVQVPEGDPPTELVVKDLKEGTGAEAKRGDRVTVQYVGVDFDSGEQFDASYDRGEAFPFTLGAGDVIPGWDKGVVGMKVGGRRELIIPPDQAYGPQGQPPTIAPNATLVLVIDLVDVQPG